MEGGAPAIRTGLFPFERCTPLDTWSVSGMRGTGSHDATFEDVFVPDAFTYQWPDPKPSWNVGPFGRIPLPTQLGGALATVAIGAARHGLDAFTELAVAKVPVGGRATLRDRPLAQIQLAQAEGWVRAASVYLRAANDEVWRMGEAGEAFEPRARAEARLASATAVKLCAQAVDLLHDAAGMTAVQSGHVLERCWRDIHTMTQHVILGTTRYEVIGRILSGSTRRRRSSDQRAARAVVARSIQIPASTRVSPGGGAPSSQASTALPAVLPSGSGSTMSADSGRRAGSSQRCDR